MNRKDYLLRNDIMGKGWDVISTSSESSDECRQLNTQPLTPSGDRGINKNYYPGQTISVILVCRRSCTYVYIWIDLFVTNTIPLLSF